MNDRYKNYKWIILILLTLILELHIINACYDSSMLYSAFNSLILLEIHYQIARVVKKNPWMPMFNVVFFIPKSISYVLIILTIANFHLKLTHFKAFTGVCLLIFVCFIVSRAKLVLKNETTYKVSSKEIVNHLWS